MEATLDPIFSPGHPVVTPQGNGWLVRSWAEYGQRFALVQLDSGGEWEGFEEELGDGESDPNSLDPP